MSKTTDQRYTCREWGNDFTQRASLSRHRGRVHSMKKTWLYGM